MKKPYTPEVGDKFKVSYTTSHEVNKGVCVGLDVPIVITRGEAWIILDNGVAMPYTRFIREYNIEKFKKL